MSQSKLGSFLEANVNTFIGLLISVSTSPFVYDAIGMKYTAKQIGLSTLFFTIISIIRGYVIRRWFDKLRIRFFRPKSAVHETV